MAVRSPAANPHRSPDRNPADVRKAPNYKLRRAVALGAVGVALGVGVTEYAVHKVQEQREQAALSDKLNRPIGEVAQELNEGKLNPEDVTVITVDKDRSAYKEAVYLAPDTYKMGYNLPEIIQEQVGTAHAGDQIVVPSAIVPHSDSNQPSK